MHVVLGLLYILLGLGITIGGSWVGFILSSPGKELDAALLGGAIAFFFFGMWLFFLGLHTLEGEKEK